MCTRSPLRLVRCMPWGEKRCRSTQVRRSTFGPGTLVAAVAVKARHGTPDRARRTLACGCKARLARTSRSTKGNVRLRGMPQVLDALGRAFLAAFSGGQMHRKCQKRQSVSSSQLCVGAAVLRNCPLTNLR